MARIKTRSAVVSEPTDQSAQSKVIVEPEDPLKLLILPADASDEARICTLRHPRTSKPCQYIFCPEKGIYEFTRIAPPKTACQSWLIGRPHESTTTAPTVPDSSTDPADPQRNAGLEESPNDRTPRPVAEGYVVKSPELFTATPIDALFLVIPSLLASSSSRSPSSKGVFVSAEDILDRLCESSLHFAEILQHARIKLAIQERMCAVCDTVEAGDEKMYRLSKDKLLQVLIVKARRLVASGLPLSMDEKFVKKALERPLVGVKRQQSSASETAAVSQDESPVIESSSHDKSESQASTVSSISSEQSAGTTLTTPDEKSPAGQTEEVLQCLRLRVALSFMMSSYVPCSLVTSLNAVLASESSPINFKPLDDELALIAKMRSEALASRSLADFSRKRGMDDDEAADLRAEKKAKKEEEEKKRKASETRGARDLKKVDVSGMKKMSDFFGKKPNATKKK
ncbi:MAG: hypothetical protein Q9191_005508 [Dirinaria sp. TL-2023a]